MTECQRTADIPKGDLARTEGERGTTVEDGVDGACGGKWAIRPISSLSEEIPLAFGGCSRARAVEAFQQSLDQFRHGIGGCFVLVGTAGTGKTTLLEGSLREKRTKAVVVSADPAESSLRFSALRDAIIALLTSSRPRTPLINWTAESAVLYASIVDALRRVITVPCLLLIDDAQWLDQGSLCLLTYIVRRLDSLPLGIVIATRPWPESAVQRLTHLNHRGLCELHWLTDLSRAEIAAIVRSKAGHLEVSSANLLYDLTNGNPFLANQLLTADSIGEAGALTKVLPWPTLVTFMGLTEEPLRLAHSASILGDSFRPDIAMQLAEMNDREATQALLATWRAGLMLPTSDGRVAFRYPAMQMALYAGIPPFTRAQLHKRAFFLLAATGCSDEATAHVSLAGGLQSIKAARLLQAAAQRAALDGEAAAARDHLLASVGAAPQSMRLRQLCVAAEALQRLRECDAAMSACTEVLSTAGAPLGLRLEAERIRIRAAYARGDAVTTLPAVWNEGRRASDPSLRDAAALLVLEHADVVEKTSGPSAATSELESLVGLSLPAGSRVESLQRTAKGLIRATGGEAGPTVSLRESATELVRDVAACTLDLQGPWSLLIGSGRIATVSESFAEADVIYRDGFRVAKMAEDKAVAAELAVGYADLLQRTGRLHDARTCLRYAQSSTPDTLRPLVSAMSVFSSWLECGRFDPLESTTVPTAASSWRAFAWWCQVRAMIAFHDGDPSRAATEWSSLKGCLDDAGAREPCWLLWARGATQAYLDAGCIDKAEALIAEMEAKAITVRCKWPGIVAASGNAALAERRGCYEAAEDHYLKALQLHDEVTLPVAEALTRLKYARLLLRLRRRSEAERLLDLALAAAVECGANAIASRVEAALPSRRRDKANLRPIDAPTKREQEVGRLAARGRTNREIADDLSISENTVETHLRSLFGKLGVKRRIDLVRRGYGD